MSDCQYQSVVNDYLASRLSPSEMRAVEEHLPFCSSCREVVSNEELFDDLKEAYAADVGSLGTGAALHPDASEATAIAGYAVVREIHRGGQGIVYEATQIATKRRVALKLLLQGTDASAPQRRRFEREVDLAASLRHPNIVTIYDSGVSEGRQFLAMEYVEGQSLTDYMTERSPSGPSRRLATVLRNGEIVQLFHRISAAIAYAHTRGIIHRDLKPANIIVDDVGEPHVLDFGLAKLAEPEAAGDSPTLTGEFIGTLAYASPEQASGDPEHIDIRTDVYSLGVILFEMLTGELPYDVFGPFVETLQNIRQRAPTRPKTVVAIDDELETIVLTALAKEPERRYQSAEHLHRDIGRYIAGEPIDAKRDSQWYLIRKLVQRYRVAMATAAALSVIVGAALVVSLFSLRRALIDRNAAVVASNEANRAKTEAQAQRRIADERRKDVEQQRKQADRQRERAEFQSYIANLAAAASAVRMHDVIEAEKRLESTRPELRGWEWEQLSQQLDHSLRTYVGHQHYVTHVAISPDGRLIAVAGYQNRVQIWDAETSELVDSIDGPARGVVAFRPDGTQLAIGWHTGEVKLWNIEAREYTASWKGPSKGINDIAFSRDGSRLAADFHPTDDKLTGIKVIVWDLSDHSVAGEISQEPWHIASLSLSPDGRTLATSGFDGVRLWDIDRSELIHELPDRAGVERCVAISRDGSLLAFAGDERQIEIWDLATREQTGTLTGHDGAVLSVEFGPDGQRLVSGSRDKTLRVWDLDTMTETRVLVGHRWGVEHLAISEDGRRLVSGSWDQSVKVWPGLEADRADRLIGHDAKVASVSFAPDGEMFATASWDHSIGLWDLERREQIGSLRGHNAPVHSVAISPDGQRLASAGWNGQLKLWDLKTRTEVASLDGHESSSRIHAVAFTPDGKWMISGASDNRLLIWNTETWEVAFRLEGHDDHIHSAVISTDGQLVASAGHQSARVWDLEQRDPITSFPRSMMQDDYSLALHRDRPWLAAGSSVGKITIWDVEQRRPWRVLSGHSDEIHAVTFSPDGSRLVSAAFDDRVKVWDPFTGHEIATLYGYDGHVTTMTFSPDGKCLIGGLDDGGIKIWGKRNDDPP